MGGKRRRRRVEEEKKSESCGWCRCGVWRSDGGTSPNR
jgi:hypothetical protein